MPAGNNRRERQKECASSEPGGGEEGAAIQLGKNSESRNNKSGAADTNRASRSSDMLSCEGYPSSCVTLCWQRAGGAGGSFGSGVV